MSHFTVLVIGNSVDEQLAPYDENLECEEYDKGIVDETEIERFLTWAAAESPELPRNMESLYPVHGEDWNGARWKLEDGAWHEWSTYSPESKWDWYSVGGRWAGFFKLKPGVSGALGEPGLFSSKPEEGYADQVRKGNVDWEYLQQDATVKAKEDWNKIAAVLGVDDVGKIIQPEMSWEQCREMYPNIDEARKVYHAQSIVKQFAKIEKDSWRASVSDYNFTEQEYIERHRWNFITTFAVLKNGEWFEQGQMGWFGMSSETDEEEEQWSKSFYQTFIEPLDDDTLLTIVDCHI